MATWLLKTEPDTYSWDHQVKRGAKGEPWSGVRNFTARRHLKEMKKGDLASKNSFNRLDALEDGYFKPFRQTDFSLEYIRVCDLFCLPLETQ